MYVVFCFIVLWIMCVWDDYASKKRKEDYDIELYKFNKARSNIKK